MKDISSGWYIKWKKDTPFNLSDVSFFIVFAQAKVIKYFYLAIILHDGKCLSNQQPHLKEKMMKFNKSLCLVIILIPIYAVNTYSQSAAHLTTFLPDTIGDFVATKAAVKKEKRADINNASVQTRIQRGYHSPEGLMAAIVIMYGHGVPDYIRKVFSKKGTLVSISKFDAIVWPHRKDDPISNSIIVSVKILDNIVVTIIEKLDLKGLSTAR
jgi:hypothetical protein